jgi:hypothetical protein
MGCLHHPKPAVLTRAQIDTLRPAKQKRRGRTLTLRVTTVMRLMKKLRLLNNDKDVLIIVRGGMEKHLNGTFQDMLLGSRPPAAAPWR